MSQLSHLTNRRGDARHGHVVYDEIKEMICQGAFDVSERISVQDLRHRFGVSKQPVMTALHQLASDGLVAITPAGRVPHRHPTPRGMQLAAAD